MIQEQIAESRMQSAREPETIQNNGASPKSLTSRKNNGFIRTSLLTIALSVCCCAYSQRTTYDITYGNNGRTVTVDKRENGGTGGYVHIDAPKITWIDKSAPSSLDYEYEEFKNSKRNSVPSSSYPTLNLKTPDEYLREADEQIMRNLQIQRMRLENQRLQEQINGTQSNNSSSNRSTDYSSNASYSTGNNSNTSNSSSNASSYTSGNSSSRSNTSSNASSYSSGSSNIYSTTTMSAYDYVNEGNSRYNNQNYTQAIVSYQNAVSLQPDMPAAYYNLGLSYCALGDYSKAVENFKKAAKREDNDTNFQKSATYYCLGWAYNQLNDKERALSCLNYTFIMYNDDYAKKAKELMQTIKSNRYSISSRTSSYDDNLRKAQQRQQAVRRVLEASRYNVY